MKLLDNELFIDDEDVEWTEFNEHSGNKILLICLIKNGSVNICLSSGL